MPSEHNGDDPNVTYIRRAAKFTDAFSSKASTTVLGVIVLLGLMGMLVAIWRVALVGFC